MAEFTTETANGAYTLSGFCKAFGVGRTFLYREIKAGRLSASKAGSKTLILRNEADKWARALPKLGATFK
ncbi:MAG TPA: helix-turn-helix domain-containing protein [Rhizomicrobium sp.]|nr:helix-turn-helix domain-containing protein [Rhizomicrobium sp.]